MTGKLEKICSCLLSAEERAQKENSAAIDNELKKHKVEMDRELKLLLLGWLHRCWLHESQVTQVTQAVANNDTCRDRREREEHLHQADEDHPRPGLQHGGPADVPPDHQEEHPQLHEEHRQCHGPALRAV